MFPRLRTTPVRFRGRWVNSRSSFFALILGRVSSVITASDTPSWLRPVQRTGFLKRASRPSSVPSGTQLHRGPRRARALLTPTASAAQRSPPRRMHAASTLSRWNPAIITAVSKPVRNHGPARRPEPFVSQYRVQVLDRTIAVLRSVADSDTDLAAAEIARQLRLHKSTVHRLLVVLEHYRLITRAADGTYRLGTALIELGESAIAKLKLNERAAPFLRELANQTGEGAHATILSGTEMLSIAHVEGRWSLQSLTRTGHRTQIHCTAAGKAVIAFLPEETCDALLARLSLKRYTRRTIVKPSAIKTELTRVRTAGFAVDDEEFEEGLRCIGAPVFDHRGHVIASISTAAPVFRLRKERIPHVAAIVIAAARGLSTDLGYQGPTELKREQLVRNVPARMKARRG
jgi:DNA-binding IclR family transcriptional regulator